MALDTRNRRASAVAFAIGHGRVWPNPDGTIDQPDRQHIAWVYPGITASAPGTPEVEVFGNGVSIPDNDMTPSEADHTDFGVVVQSAGTITRTFTVQNTGGGTLTTSNLAVPVGFTIVEGLSASITPGGSDTFQVRLDDAVVGTKSGNVTFDNNDGDEHPFQFAITGYVAAPPPPPLPPGTEGGGALRGSLNGLQATRRKR